MLTICVSPVMAHEGSKVSGALASTPEFHPGPLANDVLSAE